jgi:hypothetical protein
MQKRKAIWIKPDNFRRDKPLNFRLLARHGAKKIKHASAHGFFSSVLSLTLAILKDFVVFFQHRLVTQDREPATFFPRYRWLDSKDPTYDLQAQGSCSIGERVKEHSESDARARWRAINRNNKCTAFADVTTLAFTLSIGAGLVGPPKDNGRLQGEPNGCSGYR